MKTNQLKGAERVLSALEDLILNTPATELMRGRSAVEEARAVRTLIFRTIDRHGSKGDERSKVSADSSRDTFVNLPAQADSIGRLAFLRELARSRPDVRSQMRLAFGARESPSPKKVNALIESLIRSGVLKTKQPQ